MKFSYTIYSQYTTYGYMTAANYDHFRELFPEWRDEEIETRYLPKKAIVRPKRITKREQAIDLAYRILSMYEKTVLPNYFMKHKTEIIKELGNRGIKAEYYSRVFKGEDMIGNPIGDKVEKKCGF